MKRKLTYVQSKGNTGKRMSSETTFSTCNEMVNNGNIIYSNIMALESHGKQELIEDANPDEQHLNLENPGVNSKFKSSSDNTSEASTVLNCTKNQSIFPHGKQNNVNIKPPENSWAVVLISESSFGKIKMFLKRN